MKTYLGVDLGGTNIAVGVVTEDYKIIGRGKLPTKAPRDPGAIMDDIRRACALALDDAGLTFSEDVYKRQSPARPFLPMR